MKWLFVLLLAVVIFGGAAFFSYDLFVKPEQAMRAEKTSEAAATPGPDVSLAEFQAAAKLRQDGKLAETRDALTLLLQKYPGGQHAEEAKDLLGEVNMQILLSDYPSPEKQEYIVKRGDVIARVARQTQTTPELIMRMNSLDSTMLRIGERLMISHPDFGLFIQRKAQTVVLLNHGQFFKRYRVLVVKLPGKQAPRITTKVAEVMAWRNNKRVGLGTREYRESTRWVRLAAPGYTLFVEPPTVDVAPPPFGLGLAAMDMEELSSLVNAKTAVTITD
ncbi:MAG: LysM peptidoglycan-binding domain-containing protein [Verrucomicrobiota bacterium]|nr:LysM peptidoglycan-binding domain-containing protein [Verrucomicrobiota bacterium]